MCKSQHDVDIFGSPTDIYQQASIPVALNDRDIIGLSETGKFLAWPTECSILTAPGSGKTGAFALPILQGLLAQPSPFYALVLSPTRELAAQIAQSFKALGSGISLRCATYVLSLGFSILPSANRIGRILGGMDMVSQAIELGKKPHVVVATPVSQPSPTV